MALLSNGDFVQTPLGKGTVRECRRDGSVVVLIGDRAVVVPGADVAPVVPAKVSRKRARPAADADAVESSAEVGASDMRPAQIDLHGSTVEEALERTVLAINAALLDRRTQIRIIHGRSGGRIRVAVHRVLHELSTVRAFRIDPRNPGVTIVEF